MTLYWRQGRDLGLCCHLLCDELKPPIQYFSLCRKGTGTTLRGKILGLWYHNPSGPVDLSDVHCPTRLQVLYGRSLYLNSFRSFTVTEVGVGIRLVLTSSLDSFLTDRLGAVVGLFSLLLFY